MRKTVSRRVTTESSTVEEDIMIKASRVSSPIYSYSPLATLKPTTLLTMFNAPQLEAMAQAVEETIFKIIQETASG